MKAIQTSKHTITTQRNTRTQKKAKKPISGQTLNFGLQSNSADQKVTVKLNMLKNMTQACMAYDCTLTCYWYKP